MNKLTKSELEDKNNKDTLKNERSFAKDGQKMIGNSTKNTKKMIVILLKMVKEVREIFQEIIKKDIQRIDKNFKIKMINSLIKRFFKNDRDNQKPFLEMDKKVKSL